MQSESNPQVPADSPPLAQDQPPGQPAAPACKPIGRRLAYAASTLAALATIAALFYFLRPDAPNGEASQGDPPPTTDVPSPRHFVGWEKVKPDLVIVFSGQMHGYIQPCGCSEPQLGGLSRRYNFIESLRAKNWPVVALDVGEIPQTQGPQAMLKYITSIKALKLMGYSAIGLGKQEFNMPLVNGLGNTSLNDPLPTPISSNLDQMKKGQVNYTLNAREFKIIDTVSPRLGIVSVVDSGIQSQVAAAANVKFPVPPAQALAAALQETKINKAEVNILLYQGTELEAGKLLSNFNALRGVNKAIPPVPIVLCLSNDSEPPGRARALNGAQIMTVGHKGRYVGVIGLFRQGANFQLKYELVPIGKEFDAKPGTTNPVMDLMEEYAKEVRQGNYLALYPRAQHPLQVDVAALGLQTKYAGSEVCANCHEHAFNVWSNSKGDLNARGQTKRHMKAFKSLVEAQHPSLRQFDGECVVCHTVGFSSLTGYLDKNNAPKVNAKLEQVGCESCHGPASAHVNNPQDTRLYPLINPLSTRRIPPGAAAPALKGAFLAGQRRKQDDFCQKCHDSENDVHWDFATKWPKIEHMTPALGQAPKVGNPVNVPPAIEKVPGPGGIRIGTDTKPSEK